MAYPHHAYVSFDGDWTTADGAAEVWQFGIRVVGDVAAPHSGWLHNPQTYCDAIASPVAAWFSDSSHTLSGSARLRMLKVNNIGPDGKYADPVTHQHDYGTGVTGGNSAVGSQIMSVAVGWLGDVYSRGPAARGRIYMPNAVNPYAGAFTILAGFRDGHMATAKALLAILGIDEPDGGFLVKPSIVSQQGQEQPITQITADTIVDVQRRRKNRAVGSRSTIAAF